MNQPTGMTTIKLIDGTILAEGWTDAPTARVTFDYNDNGRFHVAHNSSTITIHVGNKIVTIDLATGEIQQ